MNIIEVVSRSAPAIPHVGEVISVEVLIVSPHFPFIVPIQGQVVPNIAHDLRPHQEAQDQTHRRKDFVPHLASMFLDYQTVKVKING